MNEAKFKVLEATGIKLDPRARYIIALEPKWADWCEPLADELSNLIGPNRAIVLPIHPEHIKVLEVMPEAEDGAA